MFYNDRCHVFKCSRFRGLAEEVGDDEMENDVCEDKVGERALGADMRELRLVLCVYLDAKADCEDEASDGGDEPREEAVEGVSADEAAEDELGDSRQQDVHQVRVHQLQLLRRLHRVVVVQLRQNLNKLHFRVK